MIQTQPGSTAGLVEVWVSCLLWSMCGECAVGFGGVGSASSGVSPAPRPDRDVFEGIVFRLVTGCSWAVASRLGKIGETTLLTRYNAWMADGVFDRVVGEVFAG